MQCPCRQHSAYGKSGSRPTPTSTRRRSRTKTGGDTWCKGSSTGTSTAPSGSGEQDEQRTAFGTARGSYIVDNFVARHELPDFDRWPDTFACLVAVVSHSSFFLALFNATLDTARAPELREWFDNGAMRVAHVAYD